MTIKVIQEITEELLKIPQKVETEIIIKNLLTPNESLEREEIAIR